MKLAILFLATAACLAMPSAESWRRAATPRVALSGVTTAKRPVTTQR
jgi:hypothetical protein